MDLGKAMDVRAIRSTFADDKIDIEPPKPLVGNMTGKRYIEERNLITRWKLEGSLDGDNYFMIETNPMPRRICPTTWWARTAFRCVI